MDFPKDLVYFASSLKSKNFWRIQLNNVRHKLYDGSPKYSWSQCAEDIVLYSLLGGRRKGFYLDLGAHDPTIISVTKLFYDIGWSGVNIEANPDKLKVLKKVRTRDLNLNYAIGKKSTYKLFIMSASSMSTVNSRALRNLKKGGRTHVEEVISVKGITLKTILKEYCLSPVDFLNIDIEGQDYEALRSAEFEILDFDLWPLWIMVENQMPIKNTLHLSSVNYLKAIGYEMYCILPHVVIFRKPNRKKIRKVNYKGIK